MMDLYQVDRFKDMSDEELDAAINFPIQIIPMRRQALLAERTRRKIERGELEPLSPRERAGLAVIQGIMAAAMVGSMGYLLYRCRHVLKENLRDLVQQLD